MLKLMLFVKMAELPANEPIQGGGRKPYQDHLLFETKGLSMVVKHWSLMEHHHSGKSSQKFLDPLAVIAPLGLNSDMILLDAGCGDGHYAIVSSGFVKEVFAIDNDAAAIRSLETKGIKNIKAIRSDLASIPLDDGYVDAILLVNVLHGLVANREFEAINELRRVLRPGGLISVIEFSKDSPSGPPKEIRLTEREILSHFKGMVVKSRQKYECHFGMILS